ncbi:hypothetical protein, partial [Cellulomonas sp. NPDC058312]|uniref:hypothetical protein n=1 Tax=Cellulomonas sp. NPDC058312 TaxID=3346441 RepID=UPI0036ED6A7D
MGQSFSHPLVQTYGIAALRHLLNSPESALEARFGEDQTALSPEAETALGLLQQVESALPGDPDDAFFRPIERLRRLSRYHEETGTTIADAIRQSAGGSKQAFNGTDELECSLIELAWHAYPLLTLQDTHSRQHLPVHVVNWESPVRHRFETALFADPDLRPLFAEKEEHGDHLGFAYTSTGSGGTTQVFGFADRILSSSWKLAHFRNEVPTEEQFLAAARELFGTLRSAMRGEQATVPVRVGLAGVLPPDGMTTSDWGWARIRPVDSRDKRFSQRTPFGDGDHSLQHSGPDGQDVQIRYSGDLVVEIDLPYRIKAGKTPGEGNMPSNPLSEWRTIEETIDNVRLALLLTGKADNITAVPTWRTFVDPLSHPDNMGWNDPRNAPRLRPTQLDQQQIKEWGEWAARIAATRTKGIGIAIRRILRAVAERRQAEDVLVDAII